MPRLKNRAEIDKIITSYKANNGNVEATARECGVHFKTVNRYVAKMKPKLMAEETPMVVAEQVIDKVKKLPDVKQATFEKLSKKLGAENIVAVLQDPAKFEKATREVARLGFMTMLVEMLDPEKIGNASLSALGNTVPILADAASGKYKFMDNDDIKSINTDEVVLKLQMSLKRIKQFNAPLSKEVEKVLKGFEKAGTKGIKKVIDVQREGQKDDNTDTGEDRK